jgi:hypothetical protein
MPSAEPAADGYAVALDEARRALDQQERAVAQLSTRAGFLISAAAVVTSVLGGPALAHTNVDAAAWGAIGAFVALTGAVLAVLRPRQTWEFALHPAPLIEVLVDSASGPGPLDLRRELALHMGASIDHNAREIGTLTKTFHIASVLLAVEIVAWVVSIARVG